MGGGTASKEYIRMAEERSNKKLFEKEDLERDILRELKKDEIGDDKWLDNHRLEAIRLTLKRCRIGKKSEGVANAK